MRFSDIEAQAEREETVVALPIYEKNGDPIYGADGEQATISVVGSDSKRVRAAERRETQSHLRRSARTQLTPEELEVGRQKRAAAAIVDWSGIEDENGDPWPCTPENARALMTAPFLLRQVEEGVAAHANFSVPTSTN